MDKNKILDMYIDAIMEAQSLWLSDYYCSSEEEKIARKNENKEK